MNPILTPVLLVVALGFVFAVILTIAAKVFFVPVDETVVKLREALPGANCGGCGFAGCDDYAAALAADPEGVGPNKCPVGGADCAAALAAILGIEAGSAEPQVATVMCNGNKQAAKSLLEYEGIQTCSAASNLFGGMNQCKYGCLGLGDCYQSLQLRRNQDLRRCRGGCQRALHRLRRLRGSMPEACHPHRSGEE